MCFKKTVGGGGESYYIKHLEFHSLKCHSTLWRAYLRNKQKSAGVDGSATHLTEEKTRDLTDLGWPSQSKPAAYLLLPSSDVSSAGTSHISFGLRT